MVDTIKILGSLLGSGALSQGSGSSVLGNVLGAALGGGSQQQSGGLGGLLGGLLGGGAQQQSSGGLGGLLGGLMGGNAQRQASPGAADLLGGLFGGNNQQHGSQSGGSLADLLGSAVTQFTQSQGGAANNAQQQNYDHLRNDAGQHGAMDQATLLIRAMINAAKADGRVDAEEQQKILGRLGDISQEEADFVRRELAEPLDVDGFIRTIPQGFEQQIYIMSLMAIDLDTNHEAQYLHQLSQGMNLSHDLCNQIHEKLGAQKLYD
ncbi:DUF533 domain-containing protein [Leucothrix pacifica]|uniref:DUF533 domain-containing protein n=1 Tax=Leucothrix pacifica TaxID=1247513 RepID=A0A317CPM9_9GAMM|nr:DUF533 domain-containing protein [Leucothrix pacifica]PWR00395.1 DUF533 domain-containing protein [Leucothrix pacifica]